MAAAAGWLTFAHVQPRVHRRSRRLPRPRPRRTWPRTRCSTTVIATVTQRMAQRPAGRVRRRAVPLVGRRPRRRRGASSGSRCGPRRSRRTRSTCCRCRTTPRSRWPGRCTSAARRSAASTARCPAARVLADETARLAGATVHVHEHLRLFELGDLVGAAGAARPAARGHRATTPSSAWPGSTASTSAAAEQAGRDGRARHGGASRWRTCYARIDDGVIWLWEDEAGELVHLTGANLPANGVTRIGPVYTPREQRGRGYASRAVAEVSPAVRRPGRALLPVHRPGQPDLEQDLRGARLPPGRRHGEPGHRLTRPPSAVGDRVLGGRARRPVAARP